MDSNKKRSESKYYNTACLMDEALILLLDKKEYSYITVKEICEKAGVNRSTFYLHYETIDDLLSECVEYIGRKVSNKYKSDFDKEKIKNASLDELLFITPEYLLPYLEFVKENKKVYKIAYSQPNVLKEQKVVDYLAENIFNPVLERYGVPTIERKYIMSFYLSGIGAILKEWIKDDCREKIENIKDILIKCLNIK